MQGTYRKLSNQFMNDLAGNGTLVKIIELVKRDSTLDFQIRKEQVHIYYRGGKIWDIKRSGGKYLALFDINYCKKSKTYTSQDISGLPKTLSSDKDVKKWINKIPTLKQIIDEFLTTISKNEEREYQQLVVRENNRSMISNGTDYFIVDIEYVCLKERFDMVAIKWLSEATHRKNPIKFKPTLVFIEMKYGDDAITGKSGIIKHINGINRFLENEDHLKRIKNEVIEIFNQKKKLGLLSHKNDIVNISEEKPELILLLAGHDPASSRLFNTFRGLPKLATANLKIAVAGFMGYGLYQEGMYDIDTFNKKFSSQISCKKWNT